MPFILVLIGALLLVAAIRNTQGDLATALATDVPGFMVWALAIVGVGALGWVPGMRQISRGLVALVLVVLVLANYRQLFAGFQSATATTGGTPATDPATAYALNPTAPAVTAAGIAGQSSGGTAATATAINQPTASPFGAFDPAAFLTSFEQGIGGFGGIA
jgi:hypothetical protein